MSNRVQLESIVTKIGNGIDAEQIDQPSDGMLPISRIETIWNGTIDFERVKYAKVTKAEIEKYALKSGDILFSHINSPEHIGKTAIYRSNQTLIHGINLLLIRVDQEKCYPEYLNYYFKSKSVRALFRARCKKAVNQASLNQPDVLSLEVPLPPLTEQKRIAALLARADCLRQLRRTAHDLGDALLQSVFLEMFYYTDSKWDLSKIEDLARKKNNAIRTGPFGSQLLHSEFKDTGDVLVFGIDNAVQNEFSWGQARYITKEKYQELKRYTVYPGDLIITIMATNGRVAVVPDNIPLAINTKHLCCITLDQNVCLPKFLQACLLYHPDVLKQMGGSERGAVMPGLNMEIIKNLAVPVPSLSLQEEFAGVVARVEGLRARMSEAERQVEGLFASLLAQSFSS
jgi:type I restriction enzyme, S subunit